MLGLIAAAIFALAFVLDLINETIGDITTTTLLSPAWRALPFTCQEYVPGLASDIAR